MAVRDDARAMTDELTALRHALHRAPEIGYDLPRTQQKVLDALRTAPTNHSPVARFDDAVLADGAALYVELALRRPDDLFAGRGARVPRMTDSGSVIGWLLDSDPSIRWQVMRDLLDAPESQWRAERAKVETEGWGARLLSYQDEDGQWAGGAFMPRDFGAREWEEIGQPWTATTFSLSQLREFGLDPSSDRITQSIELIGKNSRWIHADEPFWDGEVEECINGRIVADGAYFGVDISPIAARLAGERQGDGGWNCERINGSVRSSFASTINVLEGLLEYERATGGTPQSRQARASGEEYLLERGLFRRLRTGEPADEHFLRFEHPNRWRYDILRALDYFRSAAALTGAAPDHRLGDAVGHVRSRRMADGTWPLDWRPPGRVWFDVNDGAGKPSRWVTLRAMRVLSWWDGRSDSAQ